jgi:hypothetical protein
VGYHRDFEQAARRHYKAAESLLAAQPSDRQNDCDAGYLLGFAAECALKQMMLRGGMSPSDKDGIRAYWVHFPELKTLLKDEAHGRLRAQLLHFASNPSLMSNWHTEMRYARNSDISKSRIDGWKEDAKTLITSMEAY